MRRSAKAGNTAKAQRKRQVVKRLKTRKRTVAKRSRKANARRIGAIRRYVKHC